MSENNIALIIDDDESIRSFMRMILMRFNFSTVDTAGSGKQAISCLNNKNYSHIFLDKGLPDTDGLVLLEAINQVSPRSQVIMCTADGSKATLDGAMQHKIAGYLVKPFTAHHVAKALERLGIKLRL